MTVDRPLNCCGSTEGHLATCETVQPEPRGPRAGFAGHGSHHPGSICLECERIGHRADPVWYDRRDNIICKSCRQPVVGDGTSKDPWRHRGEAVERGVTA
jgi:hypothetical protein